MAYNVVPFHGKYCRVEKGLVAMSYSKGWTINVNLDMADSTAQPDKWKAAVAGMAGWGGSFEAISMFSTSALLPKVEYIENCREMSSII
ncbi:unnamed protein product [marine sediment metagenome]|uniref:Uncharacterized protein n=1 Tax=marine sediment metagenome TaxID=412755 RepID=X1BCA6_9ZZZZ